MFQVTPDNVIQVHHILAAEAKLVLDEIRVARHAVGVGVAAKDPVSGPAAHDFNAKIDPLVNQYIAYGTALQSAADQLKATITSYGHTEDEIKSSFGQFNTEYQTQHAQSIPTPSSAFGRVVEDMAAASSPQATPVRSLGDLLAPQMTRQPR